jgi:hypothetical protein
MTSPEHLKALRISHLTQPAPFAAELGTLQVSEASSLADRKRVVAVT